MNTRLTLALSLSLLAGLAPLAHAHPTSPAAAAPAAAEDWAWLAPFVDDSALGAIVVDLDRVDLAAVGELMNAAAGEKAPGAGQETTKAIATWHDSMVRAGAAQFVVFFTLKDPGGAPAYIIVRPRADADPKALLAHIEAPEKDGGMYGFGLNRAATLTSGCILVASDRQREGLGIPERAAVMTQAITLAGDAPIRIAMFPADFARRAITEIMPRFPEALGGGETRPIADAMVACGASLTITSAPTAHMRIASTSPEAAATLARFITERSAALPPDFANAFATTTDNSTVRVEASGTPLRNLLTSLASNVINARRSAAMMQTSVKARNIVMGCWIYAQNHNESFPDSLDQLVTEKHITSDAIKASDGTDLFVYIKLTPEQWKEDPSRTVILYQKFNAWPSQGISVGFVDGHVEIMNDQKAFEELLQPKPQTKTNPAGLSK